MKHIVRSVLLSNASVVLEFITARLELILSELEIDDMKLKYWLLHCSRIECEPEMRMNLSALSEFVKLGVKKALNCAVKSRVHESSHAAADC